MHIAPSAEWLRPELAEVGYTPSGEFRVCHALAPDTWSEPQAYLARSHSERAIVPTHFHEHPQFQVFVEGSGTFQRHDIIPITVHYTDAYVVYGPIVADTLGLGFHVLRPCRGEGAHYMPGSRDRLVGRGRRNLEVRLDPVTVADGSILLSDDDGLLATVAVGSEGETLSLECASRPSGCFDLVLEGHVDYGGTVLGRHSIVHRGLGELAPHPIARSDHAVVLTMCFPDVAEVAVTE